MAELNKSYDPAALEDKWYRWWQEKGLFQADASRGGVPYCIVIPPPNVTGILHMGHALNNTIQDILVRWKRMAGFNAVWVPGTDHAGIATQNVVERMLKKEGQSRDDLGREAFLERVWSWKEQYGNTIIGQLKKLGASCDWSRERFTMDEGLSRAVREVFVRLYDKGLIYKGNYIINWCPRCRTALSDEESEHQDTQGHLYYIRYPVQGQPGRFVVVATTRPETLLGDVAVAVNPKDERYAALLGATLRLPVLHRELPVVADDFVDPKFGTGAVKITPAHDPNDFELGRRHGLTPVNVMHEDGRMNDEAGPYAGMDRFDCRQRILADLKDAGLLEKIEPHAHAVGHCYRCDAVVEPRLSPQWFVRMKPLAAPAIQAVKDGTIRFTPDRWTKVYLEWMENIRDWCISRQIWWGHRVPVFFCDGCGKEWVSVDIPAACPACGSAAIRQDEDVLDTWFSSWLWPFSVFGWPQANADLAFYYPSHTLVTASEIIFFWVARMIMSGFEFMGQAPFQEVYIHGTVRDEQGRKMSKSLGNSIDPLSIIEKYSADALRFSLIQITATGQDVFLSDDKFEIGRNFGTKIWNAARFMQMHTRAMPPDVHAPDFALELLSADDRHLLAKLHQAIAACQDHLEKFRFNDYALAVYDFLWHSFCDWYIEYAKAPLYGEEGPRRDQVVALLHHVFSTALRLLHPLMPFLTEELWSGMGYHTAHESIMTAPWPKAKTAAELEAAWGITPAVTGYVDAKHEFIRAARTLRADYNIAPKETVVLVVKPSTPALAAALEADRAGVMVMTKARSLDLAPDYVPQGAMPSALTPLGTLFMSIEGLVDTDAEAKKLAGQLEKIEAGLAQVARKLSNEAFVSKAPPEVVALQERNRDDLMEKKDKLVRMIALMTGGAAGG